MKSTESIKFKEHQRTAKEINTRLMTNQWASIEIIENSLKSQGINEHIRKSQKINDTDRKVKEPVVKDLVYPPSLPPSPSSLPKIKNM